MADSSGCLLPPDLRIFVSPAPVSEYFKWRYPAVEINKSSWGVTIQAHVQWAWRIPSQSCIIINLNGIPSSVHQDWLMILLSLPCSWRFLLLQSMYKSYAESCFQEVGIKAEVGASAAPRWVWVKYLRDRQTGAPNNHLKAPLKVICFDIVGRHVGVEIAWWLSEKINNLNAQSHESGV